MQVEDELAEFAPQVDKDVWHWKEEAGSPPKRTPLYEIHRGMDAKLVPFAGWEMPVWYTSVKDEHRAVRETAGLFDVAHMGVFEIEGPQAIPFLDAVCSNYVAWLENGQSCYGYLLDPDGNVIDEQAIADAGGDVATFVGERRVQRWVADHPAVDIDRSAQGLGVGNRVVDNEPRHRCLGTSPVELVQHWLDGLLLALTRLAGTEFPEQAPPSRQTEDVGRQRERQAARVRHGCPLLLLRLARRADGQEPFHASRP